MKIILKQIIDIKKDPKIIIQKFRTLISLMFRLLFLPINLSIVILIIAIHKFFLIRIGFHKSKWIGSWLIGSEIFIQEKKFNKTKSLDIFIIDSHISNKFAYKKIKKKILSVPYIFNDIYLFFNYLSYKNIYFLKFIARRNPIITNDIILENELNIQAHDISMLMDKTEVELCLDDIEIQKGKNILSENIKKKYKGIVLLCVRNTDYYNLKYPNYEKDLSFRNYNSEKFLPAVNYLTSKGYLVIRMGHNNEKLVINNDLIIDYSFVNWKSPFMDYYLGYACDFCISTGFGADSFARLFRKPIGLVAASIEEVSYLNKEWMFIFNHIKKKNSNNFITLNEIFENDLHMLSKIQKIKMTNYELVQNNSQEIKDLVVEVANKFENNYQITNQEQELQKNFWKLFFSYNKKLAKNPAIDYRFANSFLKKYYDQLFQL